MKSKSSKKFNPEEETCWFTPKPLGVNTLGNIMKNISKRLNLSRLYTNHSIRATCVTKLSAEGFESREIMRVTGHKCESSLRTYDRDNTVEKKRAISEILSGNFDQKKSKSAVATPTPNTTVQNKSTSNAKGNVVNINNITDSTNETYNSAHSHFVFSNNNNCTFNFYSK